MSSLKRAWLYVIRKKSRSILLFLVTFVLACCLLAGAALKSSADAEAEQVRQSLGVSFIITVDTTNPANYTKKDYYGMIIDSYVGPVLTMEDVEQILAVDGVTQYTTDNSWDVWTDLQLYPSMYAYIVEDYLAASPEEQELIDSHWAIVGGIQNHLLCSQVTTMRAVGNGDLSNNFQIGALSIVEGRNIREDDAHKAVISTDLAERNGLTVGDTFTIAMREGTFRPTDDEFRLVGQEIPLEIVGLFQINFQQEMVVAVDNSPLLAESMLTENLVYVDMETWDEVCSYLYGDQAQEYSETFGEITFFVEDPRDLDRIMAEVASINDIGDNFIMEKDDASYQAAVHPLEQISTFSAIIMAVAAVGCLVILCLSFAMWMRSRELEAGILLSIGCSRRSIIVQFVLETILIVLPALLLAAALSGPVIEGVGAMANAMATPQAGAEPFTLDYMDMIAYIAPSGPVTLEYALSLPLGFIAGAGVLLIAVIGVLLASSRFLRESPKELLSSFR